MKTFQTLLMGAYFVFGLPALAAVVISSPTNGASVSSPVQLTASNQGSQTQSMSVYVNNSQVFQNQGSSSVSTALTLNPGTYTIKVIAQSRYSRSSSSATVNITVASPGSSSGSTTTPSSSTAAQIAADMQGSNEGHPDGVPASYDYGNGPIIGLGNNFAPQAALEWWGGLFTGPSGNPATNTLVNVRSVSLYVLSKSTGIWHGYSFPYSQISSGTYSADFATDYGTPVVMRQETDGSFSFSVAAGQVSHFFAPYPRISVNPNDIGGIVALMEARLILKNASGTDDRSVASYLLGSGADPYPSTTGAGIENNQSVANGKLKYVGDNWRSFAMTTMTQSQLTANPPPVNLTGILP